MREIGGYFELELPPSDLTDIPAGVLVNSGRHALEYILRALGNKVRHIHLPYYTCDVVLEPINRLGIPYTFYHINEDLEIAGDIELDEGEYLIANNYFGIKDRYVTELAGRYKDRLIVDNAQAWYCKPEEGTNYIYSPRKFFGLPDGGVAISTVPLDEDLPQGHSADKFSHLLKRIDTGASSGYSDFKSNSAQLKSEDLTKMSKLTERLLGSINFDSAMRKRRSNYELLDSVLADTNKLKLPSMDTFACPMVYPYMTDDTGLRQQLIDNKIFVATYWPNVLKLSNRSSLENKFVRTVLPIPIDQRYGSEDMIPMLATIGLLIKF